MEFKKLTYFMMACVAACGCASCSSDDDSPVEFAGNVQGTYKGYSEVSSAYFSNQYSVGQELTVNKIDGNTVSVSYASSSLGHFTIPEAKVTSSGSSYTISGTGSTEMGMNGRPSATYDCSLSASVDKSGEQVFVFSIPAVMGGTKVTFTQGDLPDRLYKFMVAGSYDGYIVAKCAYFDGMITPELTLVINANDDNSVGIKLESGSMGDFTIEKASVTCDGNMFKFSGSGQAEMGMGDNTKSYACTVSGTVSAGGEVSCEFSIPSVMGGMTVTFHEGEAPEE